MARPILESGGDTLMAAGLCEICRLWKPLTELGALVVAGVRRWACEECRDGHEEE